MNTIWTASLWLMLRLQGTTPKWGNGTDSSHDNGTGKHQKAPLRETTEIYKIPSEFCLTLGSLATVIDSGIDPNWVSQNPLGFFCCS